MRHPARAPSSSPHAPLAQLLRVCAAAGEKDEVAKFVSKTANAFAPKASGRKPGSKNPAYPGSVLYTVFEVQAWLSILVGGLLAFNLLWPTEEPAIPRLIGMWSVWMFAVPSLRARDCSKREKDALNVLFIALPLLNVALPFVYKSFPAVFSADVALLAALYIQNGALEGFPDLTETEEEIAAREAAAAAEGGGDGGAPSA